MPSEFEVLGIFPIVDSRPRWLLDEYNVKVLINFKDCVNDKVVLLNIL